MFGLLVLLFVNQCQSELSSDYCEVSHDIIVLVAGKYSTTSAELLMEPSCPDPLTPKSFSLEKLSIISNSNDVSLLGALNAAHCKGRKCSLMKHCKKLPHVDIVRGDCLLQSPTHECRTISDLEMEALRFALYLEAIPNSEDSSSSVCDTSATFTMKTVCCRPQEPMMQNSLNSTPNHDIDENQHQFKPKVVITKQSKHQSLRSRENVNLASLLFPDN
jgi:hypothetical protein